LYRILRSARDRDPPAVAREAPILFGYLDDPRAIVRWLSLYPRDFVRPLLGSILTEAERNRSVESTIF
jgi:hypothetical protein